MSMNSLSTPTNQPVFELEQYATTWNNGCCENWSYEINYVNGV